MKDTRCGKNLRFCTLKIKYNLTLGLLYFYCSCTWFGDGDLSPYEGMTNEEEFEARNEKALSKDSYLKRHQYLTDMHNSQEASIKASSANPRDFAQVRKKISSNEYKRILAQAELGDEDSCYQMGVIHKYGFLTGKPNMVAARRWFENAANLGSIKAKHQLRYLDRAGRPEYVR